MGVREQILALTVYDDLEFDLRKICADIAEAREKELQERMAQMIAELRGLLKKGYALVSADDVKAIINKYEVKE